MAVIMCPVPDITVPLPSERTDNMACLFTEGGPMIDYSTAFTGGDFFGTGHCSTAYDYGNVPLEAHVVNDNRIDLNEEDLDILD